jgi:NADH-ubiquinone oxidoreductase chain 5
MYLTIIFLPLLGSIIAGFFGRKTGVSGSQIITCLCIIITAILSITAFIEIGFNNTIVFVNLFK